MDEAMRRIYVASSWRNQYQPSVVHALRERGHQVYDFRNPSNGEHGFHWSEIDPNWQTWTPEEYREALGHPIAERGFGNDFSGMQWCDTGVLVLPSGNSSHLEAGWIAGSGRELYVLLAPGEPELMRKIATAICINFDDLCTSMDRHATAKVP